MGSFVIFLCIVVPGLVIGDQESKAIGKALEFNEDFKVNSPPVAVLDSETISNPDKNLPDKNLPDNNLPYQNLPDQNIPDQNIPDQNIPDLSLPAQTLPHQNLPHQNLPHQNLPHQNPSDENLPHQNLPHQNLPDGNSKGGDASVPDLVRSEDPESRKMGSPGSLPPDSKSLLKAKANCSTTPSNGTHFGTTAKHFQMLRKLAHRNIDDSIENKIRNLLQGKRMIHRNNKIWTGLYSQLPHKLRLAIAITNSYEHAFLQEAAYTQDRVALNGISEQYSVKRQNERDILKELVEEAGSKREELLASYKTLRNGESWERKNPTFVNFFQTASPLLAEYESWKRGELEFALSLSGTEKGKVLPTEEAEEIRSGETERDPTNDTEADGDQEDQGSRVQEGSSLNAKVLSRKTRSADDSVAMTESYSVIQSLLGRLPDVLKNKMVDTDNIERDILDHCAASKTVTNKEVDVYNLAKKEERELLKRVLTEADSYGPRILQVYKLVRRGKVWDYVRLNNTYEPFFTKPSPALQKYEGLKKDELSSLDAFLNVPNPAMAAPRRDDSAGVEEMYRRARAEDGESEGTEEEDEKEGEMERKLKAEEAVTFRTEEMESMETSSGDVTVTTQDINGTDDILRSPDNVTADRARNRKTKIDTRTSERNSFVGIAILLSIFINAILAIVILGLYKKELLVWYRRRKLEKGMAPKGETEPLTQDSKALRSSNTFM